MMISNKVLFIHLSSVCVSQCNTKSHQGYQSLQVSCEFISPALVKMKVTTTTLETKQQANLQNK